MKWASRTIKYPSRRASRSSGRTVEIFVVTREKYYINQSDKSNTFPHNPPLQQSWKGGVFVGDFESNKTCEKNFLLPQYSI